MPKTRGQPRTEQMEAALKTFFSSPRFAVAGASSDPRKYGHKSMLNPNHFFLFLSLSNNPCMLVHSITILLGTKKKQKQRIMGDCKYK